MRWFLLIAAALLIGANLWIVTEIHEGQRRELVRCEQVLAKELRWSPQTRRERLPADPCEAIRTVRRGR